MRNSTICSALVLSACLLTGCGGGQADLRAPATAETEARGELWVSVSDGRISLEATSMPLQVILSGLAEQIDLTFAGHLQGQPITVALADLSVEDALAKILHGRSYVLEAGAESDAQFTLRVFAMGRLSQTDLQIALTDPDIGQRVQALAEIGPNDTDTQGIATALNDHSLEVRVQAVDALETLHTEHDATMELLQAALRDEAPEVRIAAVGLLSDLRGEKSVPVLATVLNDPELTIREEAVFALASFKSEDATNALRYALDDPDEGIREIAKVMLSASGRN